VPTPIQLFELLSANPKLAYLFAATLVLAGMALIGGVVRRDFSILGVHSAILKMLSAVILAVLLTYAGDALQAQAIPAGSGGWWPTELYRLPLYLMALAYGPSPGLLMGLAYVVSSSPITSPDPQSGVLVLELVVIGWLAIYPSPTRFRWAGPFNAVFAYGLARLTGGLTLLELGPDPMPTDGIVDVLIGSVPGVLVTTAVRACVGPDRYRSWFPESRIHRSDSESAS
jgi:integral membrane sensor domain MASE1